MPSQQTNLGSLNFERADFTKVAYEDNCVWCTRGLEETYFDVDDHRVCGVCAKRAREVSPEDTRATFLRSILFGGLTAAMAGMAYYALLRITGRGWMVFASIGVGYLIGKGMRMGSNGVRGRRYQVMAAVLTYVAVTLAFSAVLLELSHPPLWAYPFLLLTPFLNLIFGHASMAGLQLLFAGAGIRFAWIQMAGTRWRITGPHTIQK